MRARTVLRYTQMATTETAVTPGAHDEAHDHDHDHEHEHAHEHGGHGGEWLGITLQALFLAFAFGLLAFLHGTPRFNTLAITFVSISFLRKLVVCRRGSAIFSNTVMESKSALL